MSAQHTPGTIRGFLTNGAWMVVVHTKKCARQRRGVTPGERARSLVPNRQEQFVVAMRDRQDARAANVQLSAFAVAAREATRLFGHQLPPLPAIIPEGTPLAHAVREYARQAAYQFGTSLWEEEEIQEALATDCRYSKDVGMWPEHRCAVKCQYAAIAAATSPASPATGGEQGS